MQFENKINELMSSDHPWGIVVTPREESADISFFSEDDESRAEAIVSYNLLIFSGIEPQLASDAEVIFRGRQMSMTAFLTGVQTGLIFKDLREADLQHTRIFHQVAAAFEDLAKTVEAEQGENLDADLRKGFAAFRKEAAPNFVEEIKARHPELFTEEMKTKLTEQDPKALEDLGLVEKTVRKTNGS